LKKSGNPKFGESRLFIENKKLVSENYRLKTELEEKNAIIQLEQEERHLESASQI